MNIASARRPLSVAFASGASALLLAGFLLPGLALGVVAVGAAWLPVSSPPTDQSSSPD